MEVVVLYIFDNNHTLSLHIQSILSRVSSKTHSLDLFPPGFEPRTFRVLGERDNHYTTETHMERKCNPRNCWHQSHTYEKILSTGLNSQQAATVGMELAR